MAHNDLGKPPVRRSFSEGGFTRRSDSEGGPLRAAESERLIPRGGLVRRASPFGGEQWSELTGQSRGHFANSCFDIAYPVCERLPAMLYLLACRLAPTFCVGVCRLFLAAQPPTISRRDCDELSLVRPPNLPQPMSFLSVRVLALSDPQRTGDMILVHNRRSHACSVHLTDSIDR